MKKTLAGRDLISINDLSKEEIGQILSIGALFQQKPPRDLLHGTLLANCFFESSTRTRLSFDAAIQRLGGGLIGFADSHFTSTQKGETLSDTMRVIGSYADIVVIRHPKEGAAQIAADATDKPVINGGDGANQHPTQTLVDLFTIQQCQGRIDHLHIGIAGDLKYGRTVHSLVQALSHYPIHLHMVASKHLGLPEKLLEELREKKVAIEIHDSLSRMIPHLDLLYMTRIQKERLPEGLQIENAPLLKMKDLEQAKLHLRILHPLPRVDEIEKKIDETPFAFYFQQAANGVAVRMALLALLMGKT